MRDDRKLLGFYDMVVDTMGEWLRWLDGRKLLGKMVDGQFYSQCVV